MSVLRFSPEHIAKVTAFQKMFWQLKTGLKHEVRTFNSFLFSAKLIGDETLEKADIEVTLREVKAKLECNEEIFEVLLTVLSRMTRGEDIVRDFRSRFDEQLKMPRPEESVDSLLSFPEPYQARLPDNSAAHVFTTPTLPQQTATTDMVFPQPMQTSKRNPHFSQARSKTQDSAVSSCLSDASEILEQPSAKPENVHSSKHTHKPPSQPQQETVPPRWINSMPAQMDDMVEEMTHLTSLISMSGSALHFSTTQFRNVYYYATDMGAQLKIRTTELHQAQQQITTLQQQNTTLQQQVANLKEEISHLKADKDRLGKEVHDLKSKHSKNESEDITPK